MTDKSTGIMVVGGLLIVGTIYLALTQPTDSFTLVQCAWLGLSGIGLIAQKKAAFTFYLVGLAVFSVKVGFGAYSEFGDILSTVFAVGLSLVLFGLPALFVWARSEYLRPWFPKDAV